MNTDRCRNRTGPRLVLGIGVLGTGAILFLRNLHVIGMHDLLAWFWAGVMVALGVSYLISGGRGRMGWAILSIAFGGLLAVRAAGIVLPFELWDLFWPAILVYMGAGLLWRAYRSTSTDGASAGAESGDVIHHTAFLSGFLARPGSTALRGAYLTAVMGGFTLDLRDAKLAPGGATIEVFAFWGGIKIRVPDSWEIFSEMTPLLGGYEVKTGPPTTAPTGRLTIRGTVVMGGVEVTR